MTCTRHHKLNRIGAVYAALVSLMICTATVAMAGPLSGPRQSSPLTDNPALQEGDSEEADGIAQPQKSATPNELFLSYLDAVRSQVLPDMSRPSLDSVNPINLDGLQGWSLDDIKAAMDDAALGLDDDPAAQQSTSQPSALTVSVEDLYNFNTGYYFVVENGGAKDGGDLVSGPNLPEIIGQTALSNIELDVVSLSDTGINLGIETGVGMLDDSFFTSTSSSSSSNRSIGGRGFRGIGAAPTGGRQGANAGANSQATSLASFITQSIQFLKDNAFSIALVVLGFTAIGYITSRFA